MLHSHTEFCDGHEPMARMAQAAFEAGLPRYGFSPHSPIPIPSPCNMKRDDVGAYIEEAERLKELYEGRMEILAGMEIDYLGPKWGPHSEYFREVGLNYSIGSVHFVPNQHGEHYDCDGRPERFIRYLHEYFQGDLEYVCRKYFEQVGEMIERGGFDILGHLDKIAANADAAREGVEDNGWWGDAVEEIIDSAVSKGLTIEINTKAYEEKGRFFPAERWWEMLRERNAKVTFHSDAHWSDRILSGLEAARSKYDTENS